MTPYMLTYIWSQRVAAVNHVRWKLPFIKAVRSAQRCVCFFFPPKWCLDHHPVTIQSSRSATCIWVTISFAFSARVKWVNTLHTRALQLNMRRLEGSHVPRQAGKGQKCERRWMWRQREGGEKNVLIEFLAAYQFAQRALVRYADCMTGNVLRGWSLATCLVYR